LRTGIAGRFGAPSLLAVLLLASGPASQAQAPPPRATPRPPVFGTGIEVINLNVSVTDARGRYVTDLTKSDFAVFEDGVRQELSIFNHEDIPISLVLMIDTSASMDEKLPTARAAAIRFVGTLRPQDNAQVMQFNDRTTILQDFVADHGALDNAISRTEAAGPTARHNALYVALKELEKQKNRGELRRRAIVLLSDGEDTASLVSDDQVLDLARKTEINIYAISLRPRRMQDRNAVKFSQAAHLLTALTQDTGGQVHFPNSLSELDAVYDRIAEELRTQYSIGYVSNNGRRDGKWRRIVVRVPTREELQVRHKLGYFAVGTATTSR
jgi:Ca-activated chloride channel family protein